MSNSLIEDYLRWLAPQIRDDNVNPSRTFEDLVRIMFEKEFVWGSDFIGDRNRLEDGLELRVAFCYERYISTDGIESFLSQEHPNPPCSFLEVLIGLSQRMAFARGGEARGWAWTLISNLELHRMSDPIGHSRARKIGDILDGCIWRNYEPSGQGGFFPLAFSEDDQRQVEIWYQMHAFIEELHPEH